MLSLDDPAALQPGVVGIKAARLAAARLGGYRVLPGLVVPRAEGRSAVDAGRRAVTSGRPAAARAAAREAASTSGPAMSGSRIAELGPRLVVRSSTPFDDDPRWAGAFASYGDVAPEEVDTAVRGCWSSVFAPDVLSRLEQTGESITDAWLAVLVQPQVDPEISGSGELTEAGVRIAVVDGHPAPLLSGWVSGRQVLVGHDGELDAASVAAGDVEPVRRVAEIVRATNADFGCRHLEWAVVGGEVLVLQLGGIGMAPSVRSSDLVPHIEPLAAYRRLGGALLGRRGPLAERLLLPWAAAASDVEPAALPGGDLAALFTAVTELAAALNDEVAKAAGVAAADLAHRLARGDRQVGMLLSGIRLDPERCGRLLTSADGLAAQLAHAGLLRAPEELWWQSPMWVEAAVAGHPAPASRWPALDRFTPLLVGLAASLGRRYEAVPAGPGLAAGRATHLERPDDPSLRPGDVLVVDVALPQFAPLLWSASALVARQGSPAAHLCEVARSLGRPAVVGVDSAWSPRPVGQLIGVDGTAGAIWISDLDRDLEQA